MISRPTLARAAADRAAALRPEGIEPLWAKSTTRVLIASTAGLEVEGSALAWLTPSQTGLAWPEVAQRCALLGEYQGHQYLALFVSPDDRTWVTLRNIGHLLNDLEVGLATAACALAHWHATHGFCNSCGAPTQVRQSGWMRYCAAENKEHYPRTEPAVIVAVEDADGRILLGRRNEWAPGRFSTLAGFVEAGESAEAALLREVAEESGIHLDPDSLRYLASQPWPFPASLMLAFRATALNTDARPDPDELAEVTWFTRDELRAACTAKTLQLPAPVSVAWHLISNWYGEDLDPAWSW